MQQYQKSFIKHIIISVTLLSTMGISNAMADNVEEAAAKVLQGFKFAKPQPAVQAPAPAAMPAAPVQAITPQPTPATATPTPVAQAPAVPVEAPPPTTPEVPAAPATDAQEATPPETLTLEADGSGIPADLVGGELEASSGTGDEGTGNGSMDTAA